MKVLIKCSDATSLSTLNNIITVNEEVVSIDPLTHEEILNLARITVLHQFFVTPLANTLLSPEQSSRLIFGFARLAIDTSTTNDVVTELPYSEYQTLTDSNIDGFSRDFLLDSPFNHEVKSGLFQFSIYKTQSSELPSDTQDAYELIKPLLSIISNDLEQKGFTHPVDDGSKITFFSKKVCLLTALPDAQPLPIA